MSVLFIAGATSFTGRAIAALNPTEHGHALRLQVRPQSRHQSVLDDDPRKVTVDIGDEQALTEALTGTDAVLQLIGTVKARFGSDGDYQKVDYQTTTQLLRAAQCAGVPRFVLLSSVGAGIGAGTYLQWKKRTEALVREKAASYSVVRPSFLAGNDAFPERGKATLSRAFLAGLSDTPFGSPFAHFRPIDISDLAEVLLDIATDPKAANKTIGGQNLFSRLRRLRGLPPSASELL